jgi:aryl-alcohol dehydrogenase-like predicted oxidoreductase
MSDTSRNAGAGLSRRHLGKFSMGLAASVLLPSSAPAETEAAPLMTRPVPSSGEALPAVGLGTAYVFDRADETTVNAAQRVVEALVTGGGRLIDTASSYGDAESVLGEVTARSGKRDKLFIATKLEAPDKAELQRSLARLKTANVDLLQLHNVRNSNQSLGRFRDWKAQGMCRYIGITSTFHADFSAVESVLRREKPDFVQIGYSLGDRTAEQRLLPLASDVNAAVLTAEPLGRNSLLRAVRGKPLPEWATDFDATSWAQFFLKYLLGHPAVTAVIPGTANPAHILDNLAAARGRLPDAAQRRRMIELVEQL